ncbi:MAG: F0F1 ATP synthase subunit alpha, partial [Vicinamibacteraceae bacterium]
VAEVGRWEQEFDRFLETRHPGILTAIAEKKTVDDDAKGALTEAIKEFNQTFAATPQGTPI